MKIGTCVNFSSPEEIPAEGRQFFQLSSKMQGIVPVFLFIIGYFCHAALSSFHSCTGFRIRRSDFRPALYMSMDNGMKHPVFGAPVFLFQLL